MDRNGFGEKAYRKTSIVLNPDDLSFEIIDNKARLMHEIDIDYTEKGEVFKDALNDIVINDITEFNNKHSLKDSIVKVAIKVSPDDISYKNETLIAKHIMDYGAHNCVSVNIYATYDRQLRNSEINETLTTKDAIAKFIKSKSEYSDEEIQEMIKLANAIIDEVDEK